MAAGAAVPTHVRASRAPRPGRPACPAARPVPDAPRFLRPYVDQIGDLVNTINGPRVASAFDGWFRYPAGFSQATLDACAEAVRSHEGRLVIGDPFAGVATQWGPAAWRNDGRSAASRRIPWSPGSPSSSSPVQGPHTTSVGAARDVVAAAGRADVDGEHVLVRRTFGDEPLALLVGLRDALPQADPRWQPHLELALLSILRYHASVKVGWPYPGTAAQAAQAAVDRSAPALRRTRCASRG